MSIQSGKEWELTGRHVFFMLLAFFGFVFAVNGVMMAEAIKTNSGMVANEPYRKGLKYNERIAADQRQSELGWTSDVTFAPDGRSLVVVMNDRDGKPVSGFKASAVVGRPATDREDVTLNLIEEQPGRYTAPLPQRERGTYLASVAIKDAKTEAGEPLFRARRRLWVEH